MAFPVLSGDFADNGDHVVVRGSSGEVRLDGSRDEIDQVLSLLAALEQVGALAAEHDSWLRFHSASSNPVRLRPGHDPFQAYDLPRLALAGTPVADPKPVADPARIGELASRRRSADPDAMSPQPAASLEAAIGLAYDAYRLHPDGHRAVASGGALYPLCFWVIGADEVGGPRRILAIDHDRAAVLEAGTLDAAELAELFVPDPAVLGVLERGAAVILIAADPTRTVHKYSDRGWRFALMECGAVMHHISLAAEALGAQVRPIGGFLDQAVRDRVGGPALPLLFLLVAAP